MNGPQVEQWRLCVLCAAPAIVDLAVCAARHNVQLTGIHCSDHHAALLASLRIGCNAYSTAAEAKKGANVILLDVWPNLDSAGQDVLVLLLEGSGGLVCAREQLSWAEEFLGYVESTTPVLARL